ncbi:MAG: hypothetical protein PHH54_02090 [Candidatus Nanoarchaeia archaeon]|nr:hypothetical protein [Candidatus Nanoarchaeia archaeon]MDD5740752.1 hypothetical protein [Candidatus Nanoarchaeia archaeon]
MTIVCPKCESRCLKIDNFCIGCGKDLRIIKKSKDTKTREKH